MSAVTYWFIGIIHTADVEDVEEKSQDDNCYVGVILQHNGGTCGCHAVSPSSFIKAPLNLPNKKNRRQNKKHMLS